MTTSCALLVGVSVALTACGGASGSSSSGSTEASADAGLTPPGTQLALGEAATVTWVPRGRFDPAKAQPGIELEVTVKSIEEGSAAELTHVVFEPSERGADPFYVHLELTAPTGASTPAGEDPARSFEAIDDREEAQSSVTFVGAFAPCEETPEPKPFSGGASYQTCLMYPMTGGHRIESVEWNSGPSKAGRPTPYFEHPLAWKAGR
jgi:hypothetical protein